MGKVNKTPFYTLGSELRTLRLRAKESLLEVSAAVEITGERLARIENGELCPAEDILDLLLTHYNVTEKIADKLQDLAGYKKTEQIDQLQQQAVVVLPIDARILYTDAANVTVNDAGVVINFMQANVANGQSVAVSRVGMSKAHAVQLINILQMVLNDNQSKQEPRQLPAPDDK